MATIPDPLAQAQKYYQRGEFSQALLLLQFKVKEDPRHAVAFYWLGISLMQMKRLAEAQEALESAVRLQPAFAEAHCQLGLIFREQQKPEESLGCFLQALASQPHFPEAHLNLGISLSHLKKKPQAISHYRQAIAQHPDFADAHLQLATELEAQERWEEAISSYRRFLELQPGHVAAHNFLGILLANVERFEEAVAEFRTVIRLRPDGPAGYHNLGVSLSNQDVLTEALRYFDEALRHKPDHGEAHKSKGVTLLKLGQLREGWAEYEWRLKCEDNSVPHCSKPMWDGSALHGKTILLRAEQGYGDSLQFIRYARLVKEFGGIVLFESPAGLARLLSNCEGIDRIVLQGAAPPEFDVYAPLMSLPRILNTSLKNVPARIPYLFVDAPLVEHWHHELRSTTFNVGIAWQGNPRKWSAALRSADQRRSIPLALFEPLATLPGVKLYSLQKGFGTEQLQQVAGRFDIVDLGDKLNDFMDTAAVMKNLDLVITADSSPAHLAGGLGVPVWVPLPFLSCWRWLTRREDTPWYPLMRLFRQAEKGNWNEVFSRMTVALRKELQRAKPPVADQPSRPVHSESAGNSGRSDQTVMTPKDIADFHQWFRNSFQHLLENRYATFYQALMLAVARKARVLVETGTTRQPGNWAGPQALQRATDLARSTEIDCLDSRYSGILQRWRLSLYLDRQHRLLLATQVFPGQLRDCRAR